PVAYSESADLPEDETSPGRLEDFDDGCLHEPVLGDPAEIRLARIRGIEHENIRARRRNCVVPHAHALVGLHAWASDASPGAGACENALARAGERRDARFEGCAGQRRARVAVLQDRDVERLAAVR